MAVAIFIETVSHTAVTLGLGYLDSLSVYEMSGSVKIQKQPKKCISAQEHVRSH